MLGIFGFLGFIIILVFIIIFIVLAFLGNIVRSIFGLGKRAPKQYYGEKTTSSDNHDSYSSTQGTTSPTNGKKKIFAYDEGEYVEFEEVK
jgi:hypothetical protein